MLPESYVSVGLELLDSVLAAAEDAPEPTPDTPRVVSWANNGRTSDYVGWGGCGHWYQWRDCLAYFTEPGDPAGQWCPACLPAELRRGDVVLSDPEHLRKVIADLGFWL